MTKKTQNTKSDHPDCFSIACGDACCQYGVDVTGGERKRLIASGQATASNFRWSNRDEDGVVYYRTRKGARGCVFLKDSRGCKLHGGDLKPVVCSVWPRTHREAREAAGKGALPCFEVHYRHALALRPKAKRVTP